MNSSLIHNGSVKNITRHITVLRGHIGMKPLLCVYAQQLHNFFGIALVFREWFTESVNKNGFASGRDFTAYNKHQIGRGRPAVDYLVSLSMAIEMAAKLHNNLRATQCKRYLMEIEASENLPDEEDLPDVFDVIEMKFSQDPAPVSAPAEVSLQAGSIPVTHGVIGGVDALVVDARNLHHFLGVGKMFAHWIKKRIDENSYVNGKDYALIDRPTLANQKATSGRGGDRKSIGYLLSLNTAKEVAMMERNAQGRAVRNYFIDCEKQLYTQLPPTVAEDPPKVAPAPNSEYGASTRIVAGDSIVMSPGRFDGFRAVMRARQDRLAILCCEVYTVSLKATEDKAIAELTTAAFLKVATPKLTKIASESDLDIATPDGLKAMIDAFNGWTHQPAT